MNKRPYELLVLTKIVRERVNILKALLESSAKSAPASERVKLIDKKTVKLQRFLLKIDCIKHSTKLIKQSNIEYDEDDLLSPI